MFTFIKIKYGKDYTNFFNCYNVKECRKGNIEYVEFDKIVKNMFKRKTYHYTCGGRIILKIKRTD